MYNNKSYPAITTYLYCTAKLIKSTKHSHRINNTHLEKEKKPCCNEIF